MMAWSSRDADADLWNNGWDIVARPFTFIGNIPQAGAQARVNTQLFGDQHSPQVSALGNNYMTVWTSLHQDGNREGIYGQFLNADGSHAGDELRVNTTTRGMQQQPAVASDNHGRFLTVWTGPTFGPSQNDLFAQVYASSGYSPVTVANNFGSPTFVGQTTSPGKATTVGIHDPSMEPPTLDYPGVITAGGSGTPAVNAFSLAAGKYSGLFYDLNGVSSASAGYFSATVNASKGYSASLTFAGGKYSLSGKLDDLGNSGTRIITRNGGLPSLRVSFQVDLFGADQIAGTVQGGGDWNAVIQADRQVFNSKTAPSPFAGSYTLTIPGFAGGPGGTSVGTLVSGTSGNVVFKGTLANGKTVTQTSAVSKSGVWPLFALEGGGAVMMSWVDFAADPLGGELAWIKPSFKGKGFYPAGYTNGVTATVTLTSPVVSGMRQLDLNGAGLGQTLSYFISLGADGRAVTNGVALKVTPATGAFSGKVANPTTGKPAMVINGVLINGNLGEGFFLGTSESGKVTLQQP